MDRGPQRPTGILPAVTMSSTTTAETEALVLFDEDAATRQALYRWKEQR